jgi:hypothetical protein
MADNAGKRKFYESIHGELQDIFNRQPWDAKKNNPIGFTIPRV